MSVLVTCKFDHDLIKNNYTSGCAPDIIKQGFLGNQGQVTPKQIERSCRNLNSSKILCLSRLSATFIKIQSKQNRLCSKALS